MGPSGPAIGFGVSTEAQYHGYVRSDQGKREALAHRRVAMFTRFLVLGLIGASIAWGTARVQAEPPPQSQPGIVETIRDWLDWWWGIKPRIHARRVYIGGDG